MPLIISALRAYATKPSKQFRVLAMPKERLQYLKSLEAQRQRLKAQATKYSPSKIYLQVIGNGSRSEPSSIILCTDHTTYLFNCGEGTQRLAYEYHSKLTRLEHIFVTRPVWYNIGGIPGVQLTIQDTGVPQITLHGPDGTCDLVEATENFVTLNNLKVYPADTSTPFNDHTMKVTYVPLENPERSDVDEPVKPEYPSENINYYDRRINMNNKRPRSPDSENKRNQNSKSQKRINSLMAYICELHSKPGTLNIEKCMELGVPKGPLLGRLKNGHDITLPDGRLIRSTDVKAIDEPAPLFVVVECPDESWIDVVVDNPVFSKHHTDQNNYTMINYIVHFTPENVLNNLKYKKWMGKFGAETKHFIINEKNSGFSSEAIFKMQCHLNLIHPKIFPMLETLKSDNSKNQNLETTENNLNLHYCKTLHKIHLRPHNGLEPTNVSLNQKKHVEDIFEIENFTDTLNQLRVKVNDFSQNFQNFDEYPKLTMLGTGSSIPNKVRNTSGILLQIDEGKSIIMDCAEGTFGQMYKLFGESKVNEILKSIKVIYVSHLHADHHLGLIGILKEREKLTTEPVYLLAPQQIVPFLCFYHNRFESISKLFRIVSNRDIQIGQSILSTTLEKELLDTLNVSKIETCFVKHCPYAFAVAVTLKDGKKITYSGDCMPTDPLYNLAKDSYLLIHEATMEDSLEAEAKIKYHSTMSQAVNTGIKSGSKFTLLTHFSQRYSKLPMLPILEEGDTTFNNVGIAYDFMQISLSQLSILPLFYPALNCMFSEFRSQLDVKTTKRGFRKELMVNVAEN